MDNPVEISYVLKLILSVVAAAILFAIALYFITKTNVKRQRDAQVHTRDSLNPFPQTATLPDGVLTTTQRNLEERAQTIREHYRAWLERNILPTHDARGAFVRTGAERRRLRYQVTNTSLAQGMGMILTVLISGDDLSAPDRFERLLGFAITHPSAQSEHLSTWYTLPDMSNSPRLEADPHAEAWIAYSLLMAEKQWREGDLFDYDRVLNYRLPTLLTLQKDIEPSEHKRAIYAPLFFDAFGKHTDGEAWRGIARDMRAELLDYVKGAEFAQDGSAEEAWFAFSALHVGLAGLLMTDESNRKLSTDFESLVYSAIKTLPESLSIVEDDGLTSLALLSCCAPLAMLQNDQDLVNRYWQVLSNHKVAARDAIGESLQLLALMALNGNIWQPEA